MNTFERIQRFKSGRRQSKRLMVLISVIFISLLHNFHSHCLPACIFSASYDTFTLFVQFSTFETTCHENSPSYWEIICTTA